ncbi:DNA polymerase delta subunit 4 [Erysiphe neolycopersici]|uniref:DNA polymerase delta subunit 4 n=1 Tax=Erysiphe neolycopersici TaxID=212602 RepID=A0A420I1Y8_9PEZI|nr:DNA polymerase delta subunit 4 [Erysiphe neolycopersici]
MPVTKRTRMSLGTNASKSPLFRGSKITKPGSSTTPNAKQKSQQISKALQTNNVVNRTPKSNPNLTPIVVTKKHLYTPEEKSALQVSDLQLKQYWLKKERERLVFTVHQTELSEATKILRLFDMSSQYGPCIGISRSKRWARAHRLGLSPPIEVLAILLKQCNLNDARMVDRAYVDELINSVHHPNISSTT